MYACETNRITAGVGEKDHAEKQDSSHRTHLSESRFCLALYTEEVNLLNFVMI